jgi:hypothetical protein
MAEERGVCLLLAEVKQNKTHPHMHPACVVNDLSQASASDTSCHSTVGTTIPRSVFRCMVVVWLHKKRFLSCLLVRSKSSARAPSSS